MRPSRKAVALRTLTDYFLEKGEILDKNTYAKQKDTPIPPRNIKRLLGNWSRLPRMIKVNFPEDYENIVGIEQLTPEEIDAEIKAENAKIDAEDARIEAEEKAKQEAEAVIKNAVKEVKVPKAEVKND